MSGWEAAYDEQAAGSVWDVDFQSGLDNAVRFVRFAELIVFVGSPASAVAWGDAAVVM